MRLLTALCFLLILQFVQAKAFAMGSSKPKPSPTPTPSPTPYTGDVWFASNVATPDFVNLFTEPNLWPQAKSKVSTFQLYAQHILSNSAEDCAICGVNTYPHLVNSGVFTIIRDGGHKLAVETGSVKDFDCTGEQNRGLTNTIFEKVKAAGARVHYISMDEPYVSGLSLCNGYSAEQVSDNVANYMRASHENYARVYPGETLSLGLIEAYPHFSADKIVWFLQLLAERNSQPAFLNLDFDHWAARNEKMSEAQIAQDLKKIQVKCQELGIPLGMIIWGHDGDNATKFGNDAVELAQKVKRTLGRPERVIIQSWSRTKNDKNLNPSNLSESQPTSLTGILMRALSQL